MESKIFEGKTTNEAIQKGLMKLRVSKSQVDIKVLEEEKRSFFSILTPRVVRVEMTVKEGVEIGKNQFENDDIEDKRPKKKLKEAKPEETEKAKEVIEDFLKEFLAKLPNEPNYSIETDKNYINVSLNGDEYSYLIGYRGETILSLQSILNSVIRGKTGFNHVKTVVDVCGYKNQRKSSLEELADNVAKKVIETKQMVKLEPMKPYERKIVHSKLQLNEHIKTKSHGEEPYRCISVYYKE